MHWKESLDIICSAAFYAGRPILDVDDICVGAGRMSGSDSCNIVEVISHTSYLLAWKVSTLSPILKGLSSFERHDRAHIADPGDHQPRCGVVQLGFTDTTRSCSVMDKQHTFWAFTTYRSFRRVQLHLDPYLSS